MAGERILPGLGLRAFWTLGSQGWKDQNDTNWLMVSALLQAGAISRDTVLPGSPTDGDIYIIKAGETDEYQVTVRDNGVWVLMPPSEGWLVYVQDEDDYYKFDGSIWLLAFSGGMAGAEIVTELDAELGNSSWKAPTKITVATDSTSAYVATTADFAGGKMLTMTNAGANTVTVNSGMTGTEPFTVAQKGAGQTTFVAGASVTISSADANMLLRAQYSSGTLIPDGTDNYILVGDLTT